MEAGTIFSFFFITTFCVAAGKYRIVACEEDHDCGENMFCYATGLCALCTNCAVYSRKPHEWRSCAKSPKECGDCLPGYAADTLTDGTARDLCTQIKPTVSSTYTTGDTGQSSIWLYVLLVGIPSVILMLILLLYIKTGVCRVSGDEVVKVGLPVSEPANMRPPPYCSSGESPLLMRSTGCPQIHCDPVWHCDPEVGSSSYQNKESDEKTYTMEMTRDGYQQARPFEYNPDDFRHVKAFEYRTPSRTRSSCRPDDQTDHYDQDDDNEDGRSVTCGTRANRMDPTDSGLPRNAGQQNFVSEDRDTNCTLHQRADTREQMYERPSSFCDTASWPDHSSYSLCSETGVECRCQGPIEPVKCSSEKNILEVFPLTLKFDSGFVSQSSNRFEELHDNTTSNGSTEGEKININLPVSINILNTVNVVT